jgi:hypothetical protein
LRAVSFVAGRDTVGGMLTLFHLKHVQESILFSILQIGKSRNHLKSIPAKICNLITVFLFADKKENQRERGLMSELELNNETDALQLGTQ